MDSMFLDYQGEQRDRNQPHGQNYARIHIGASTFVKQLRQCETFLKLIFGSSWRYKVSQSVPSEKFSLRQGTQWLDCLHILTGDSPQQLLKETIADIYWPLYWTECMENCVL